MYRWYRVVLMMSGLLAATVGLAQKTLSPALPAGGTLKGNPQLADLYDRYRIEQLELDERGMPAFLAGDLTPAARSADPVALAQAFFAENRALYRLQDPPTELRLSRTTTDEAGITHLTFQQYYHDVPVLFGELKAHVSSTWQLVAVNGRVAPDLALATQPTLAATDAEARAAMDMGVARASITFGATELVIFSDAGTSALAWRVDVVTATPEAWWYLIDAQTGQVLHRYARLYDAQSVAASELTLADLHARELAPLDNADEERFLLAGEVWTRRRGEYSFARAQTVTDLAGEARQQTERTGSRVCDVTLDLRRAADYALGTARGYRLQPTGTEGVYRTTLTKAECNALAEVGIALALYPQLPEAAAFAPPPLDDHKPGGRGAGNLDEALAGQTFEGTFPAGGWQVADSNALGGADYWDDASCRFHSGAWSAWCADAGASVSCSHYDNHMQAAMRAPVVNLSGRVHCQASYWWWNDSEPEADYFREYYSADGVHWTLGGEWSGNSGGWQNTTVTLNGFANYYMLFLFSSDASINSFEGAYVDDVSVTGEWAPCGEIGSGPGVMGTNQSHIDADYAGELFRLNDLTRRTASSCWHNHGGAMTSGASITTYTYTTNFPTSPGAVVMDADNLWSYPAAVDAHVYATLFYDYTRSQLGRNGHSGDGLNMWSTVDVATLYNNAAYWGGRVGYGTVGTGHRSMAGAPDIVAHEWGHGITEFESRLVYEKESGALNEAFADMIGTAFGFATGLDADWLHGENWNTSGAGNRSLSNPPQYNQPDYYGGTHWVDQVECVPWGTNDYCGVHTNSGVGNKFFYLLSEGGSFHGITVTGIGVQNAMKLVYRANRDYWSATATYATARAGCITAAMASYPAYVSSVKDAWAAVGVGDPTEHPLNCAGSVLLSNGVGYNGTTVGGNRNVMDYGCSPWNEAGPEKVHRMVFTGPMTLTVTLSNLGANDLDVFLLSSCSDAGCVAYGDDSLNYSIPAAGTYYIVVDGFEGAQGTYRLTATALGSVALITPNGGETWYTGENRAITWNSTLTENLKIEIDRNYPSTWTTLASGLPNTGSYSWPVTGTATANARVRISGVTHTTVRDTSNANFAITVRSLVLTSPSGGESWTLGTPQTVTWTSSGLAGEAMKIELKRGYPGGVWQTLVASTPNTGTWTWTPTGAASPSARLRITGTVHRTISDTSNANFTLTSGSTAPSLTVILPNGGEYWPVGSVQTISWTSSNLAENVKIEVNRSYPTDDWEIIAASTANDGSHSWTVIGSVTGTARVRITGTVSTAVTDVSDAMFTISGGSAGSAIAVTSPNGGDQWVIGTRRTITWSAPALAGNVKLEINRNYPSGAWQSIISSTTNDGAHSWLVTPGATQGARIRISSITTPLTHDVSDGNFTISSALFVSGVARVEGPVPTEAYLTQNYPNPFNPSTTFEFGVPEDAAIRLRVFDITGREVALLIDNEVAAGRHRVTWNCADCPAGIYLVALDGAGMNVVRKATFLK